MDQTEKFLENSEAVQAHLNIIQSVIQRMSANSASAKAWCITLVSAILVIVADKGKANFTWIALIPTILFLVLDAYYLGLEKAFRDSYNNFIIKLHNKKLIASDLFAVTPSGSLFKHFMKSLISFSVWPFYLTLILMIFLAGKYLL
jgi:hypothetical protein